MNMQWSQSDHVNQLLRCYRHVWRRLNVAWLLTLLGIFLFGTIHPVGEYALFAMLLVIAMLIVVNILWLKALRQKQHLDCQSCHFNPASLRTTLVQIQRNACIRCDEPLFDSRSGLLHADRRKRIELVLKLHNWVQVSGFIIVILLVSWIDWSQDFMQRFGVMILLSSFLLISPLLLYFCNRWFQLVCPHCGHQFNHLMSLQLSQYSSKCMICEQSYENQSE